jgi:hypothetical protein
MDVKAVPLYLAIRLTDKSAAFQDPGGDLEAPFDRFLALEVWAVGLAMGDGNLR